MSISSGKPDLVLFVGPVDLRQLRPVKFEHPTEVVMVHAPVDASSSYRELARQGLAKVVQDFTGKSVDSFRKIAISAFSKGGSFTDEVLTPAARGRVDAVVLNDAVFGDQHSNLQDFLDSAAAGDKLLVITNSNNRASDVVQKRARESVEDLIGPEVGPQLVETDPAGAMPRPDGGVWKLGDLFWYDYVDPITKTNQITHAEHHNLADAVWVSHVSPYLAKGKFPVLLAALGAVAAVGTIVFLGRK